MTYEERVPNAYIGSERADLVLAGCAILEAIRRAFPCPRLRIADRGLREGIYPISERPPELWFRLMMLCSWRWLGVSSSLVRAAPEVDGQGPGRLRRPATFLPKIVINITFAPGGDGHGPAPSTTRQSRLLARQKSPQPSTKPGQVQRPAAGQHP